MAILDPYRHETATKSCSKVFIKESSRRHIFVCHSVSQKEGQGERSYQVPRGSNLAQQSTPLSPAGCSWLTRLALASATIIDYLDGSLPIGVSVPARATSTCSQTPTLPTGREVLLYRWTSILCHPLDPLEKHHELTLTHFQSLQVDEQPQAEAWPHQPCENTTSTKRGPRPLTISADPFPASASQLGLTCLSTESETGRILCTLQAYLASENFGRDWRTY